MHATVALPWSVLVLDSCVFKFEAGLEVRLVGRIVTIWGELRGPFRIFFSSEVVSSVALKPDGDSKIALFLS